MRIIDYTKTYDDGHSIRLEFNASNAPFVHVDGKLHDPAQVYAEGNFDERKTDSLYKLIFHREPNDWSSRETIYQEEGDSEIYGGFIIKKFEERNGQVRYECDYAGKKYRHNTLVIGADWQKFLFNKWQQKYPIA